MCPGLLLSRGSRQPKPGFNFDGGSRGGEKKHPPQHGHAVLVGSLKRIPAALLFLLVGSADASLCACSCPSKDWGSVVRAHISVCVSDFPVTRLTRRAVFSPSPFPVHHGAVQPLLAELHSDGEKLREGTHQ